jgi:hypothetical protein
MLTRVSNIETFRRWRLDEEQTAADLVARLTDFQPTEPMLAGTAFHKALEQATEGDYEWLEANGYRFRMMQPFSIYEPTPTLALPDVRELRAYGQYGPLTVTGQVDALHGKRVEDHKTTASFRPDGYLEGCQWRFYLDIFDADIFRWNVFQITPVRGKAMTYTVAPPQLLEQVRYPGLHNDCERLAADYYEFACRHMPDHMPALVAA